ncbi:MAG: type II secretion system F family protein [Alphaproteobacteria bacterium]|nr:MAG: type II secretion system F family protein [Alphaproteobacteria bacterium]
MPQFSYKAVAADGEIIEGEIEAPNRDAVVEHLHAQGAVPIRAEEQARALRAAPSLPRMFRVSQRMSRRDVALLTRELATLLQAGLPLDRALGVMLELGTAAPVRVVLESLRDQVRGGATLADAMQEHPDLFPNYYVGMVRAGEAGGSLDAVLARLAETLERAQALRDSVRAALRYPALVVFMAAASLFVLMTAVIPEFRPLFEDAGAAMPTSTRVVIAVSDFLAAYWWALGAAVLAAVLIIRRHNATPTGRLRWDAWRIRAPVIGDLTIKVEVARFSRTLGTLLSNGVSVLNAMSMTIDTLDNRAVATAVAKAQGRLAKGEGLSAPLAETGVFPGLALQLVRVGEETGHLDAMLLRIAEIYDQEVKRALERMLSLLVPAVTLGLGLLIAVIIGSMMAAIMSVYDLPF